MKFQPGDCLSLQVEKDVFLAGFVALTNWGKYQVVLSPHEHRNPPTAADFPECSLFAIKYELGENSIIALDAINVNSDFLEQSSSQVQKVFHIQLPGSVNAGGFTEISNMEQLRDYYLRRKAMNEGSGDQPPMDIGIKCSIILRDYLTTIRPTNEFGTIKLYKKIDDVVNYWQVYGNSIDPLVLVMVWGKLGERGAFNEIKDRSLKELRTIYEAEISQKKREGYKEAGEMRNMILQLPTGDAWGNQDDLSLRNEVWNYLEPILFWTGLGSISGGDIGSGTVNLFFNAVDPMLAVDTIVKALDDAKIDREFIIALEEDNAPTDNESYGFKVLHPKDYEGTFFY